MNKTQTKKVSIMQYISSFICNSQGHLHIADMARTNFAANSFDAIFARETLEYIGNKNAMLKRALVTNDSPTDSVCLVVVNGRSGSDLAVSYCLVAIVWARRLSVVKQLVY